MKKMNLMTPINPLGYGVAGLNIFRELVKSVDVTLFPIGQIEVDNQDDATLISQHMKPTFDHTAPCLKIWHEFHMAERIGSGPFFGFPFFEITQFDETRISHLNSCDKVIVASNWAKEIVEDQVPNQESCVAPLGVNTDIFDENLKAQATGKCVFLNCGKWEKRKGHDILLEMFKQAFPHDQDVELWMLTSNPFLNQKETDEWVRYYQSDPRVKIIPRQKSHADLAAVMAGATCGIFPSRAEGWNLELLEMMALGKPVIATNYSAHTEFCTEENCMLINIEEFEAANDGKWFQGDVGDWACLEGNPFNQVIHYMREIYEEYSLPASKRLYNLEGVKTAQQFSWVDTAIEIEGIIYD